MLNEHSRVLIVDDFEMVRVTLKDCLKQLGYQDVAEAADGKEALEVLQTGEKQKKQVSIIFCDLNMPNMNGIDLLIACKKDPSLSKIPFVMVSAESERAFVVQSLQQGASDYIIKPFSTQTLQKKIEKVTRKFQQAA